MSTSVTKLVAKYCRPESGRKGLVLGVSQTASPRTEKAAVHSQKQWRNNTNIAIEGVHIETKQVTVVEL